MHSKSSILKMKRPSYRSGGACGPRMVFVTFATLCIVKATAAARLG